mgnify:CR=1 FL=1
MSWNAGGLSVCETEDQDIANASRKSFTNYVRRAPPCVAPEFLEDLRFKVGEYEPTLVVIATQNESLKRSYFHDKSLLSAMKAMNFQRLVHEKASVKTGKRQFNPLAVEMSIFMFKGQSYKLDKKSIHHPLCEFSSQKTMAAIICTLSHPLAGKQSFVALHTLARLTAQTDYRSSDRSGAIYSEQQMVTTISQRCTDMMLMPILNRLGGSVTIAGDFHQAMDFDTDDYLAQKAEVARLRGDLRQLQAEDPLTEFRRERMPNFVEGVNDDGPDFFPTCGLRVGRDPECIESDLEACYPIARTGYLGWCNRILYRPSQVTNVLGHFVAYERVDILRLHESDQAAVLAVIED